MKLRTRLMAAMAVPIAAAGAAAVFAGPAAHAATGYTDTSVSAGNFVFEHQVGGTLNASDVGNTAIELSGLHGAFAPGMSPNQDITYSISAGADVDGVILSVTNTGFGAQSQGLVTAKGNLNQNATAPVKAVVTVKATDTYGDTDVISLPVAVSDNSLVIDTANDAGVTVDSISKITAADTNPNGSVTFSAKDTADVAANVAESNLPAGLTSGNPLLPGTAVPGKYKGVVATATDADGASASATFDLTVNGSVTPTAPVPVLSHGSATYVSPTRENVYFDTTITTWVHFQIVGPGAINGHQGWVLATAGQLNHAVYTGLEANHGYTVYYTPVTGQGSTTQIDGTHTGYVFFVTNRP